MPLTKVTGGEIDGASSINVTGIVTATSFSGDVSGNINSSGVSTFSTLRVGTGVTISSGVVTATSFVGNLTGNVTGNVTGNATGLSGTPSISVDSITAATATFTGNVSVAGTVTYEDVTNIDSIGIVTARGGLRVGTGGTVITTTTDGLVGIGTNNPQKTLDVRGDISVSGGLVNYLRGDTVYPKISINGSSANDANGDVIVSGYYPIIFKTDLGFERMRVDRSGNVGIGTTNPQNALHVQGTAQFVAASANSATVTAAIYANTPLQTVSAFFGKNTSVLGLGGDQFSSDIRFNGNDVAWGDISYYPNQGGQGHFRFSTTSNTVNTTPNATVGVGALYSAGSVGIGTTNTSGKLVVDGSASGNSWTNRSNLSLDAFKYDNTGLTVAAITADGASTNGGVLQLYDRATGDTQVHLDSAPGASSWIIGRNIGIGTNNPSGATVDIFAGGTTSAFSLLRISNLADGATAGSLGLQKFGSAATSYGPYSANNVGIDATFTQFNLGTQTGHPLTLYTSNVERARITSSGTVGIGTTNPGRLLNLYAATTPIVRLTHTTASSYAGLEVYEGATQKAAFNALGSTSSATGGANAIQVWNFINAPTVFGTNNIERVRITGIGSFGIGVADPEASFHLRGTGGTAGASLWRSGSSALFEDNVTNGYFKFVTGTYTNQGSVNLDLITAGNDYGYGLGWRITSGADTSGAGGARSLRINSLTSNGSGVIVSTERVRISDSGNVSIGTTITSGAKLQVTGDSSTTATQDSPLYVDVPHSKISMFVGRQVSTSGFSADTYTGTIRFNGSDVAWGDVSYYPNGDGGLGSFRFTRNGSTVSSTPNARIGVGGIWMPSAGKITLNNGDAEIEGQSSYHLRIRTYDGSSSMRQIMKFQGGTSGGHVTIGGDANGPSNGYVPLHFASSKANSYNGYTHGGSTLFIGQISPGNSGNTYLHVKFDVPFGSMFYLRSWGYVYGYGQVYNSWCAGYLYNNSVISSQTYNSNGSYGITNVYYTGDGNVALRLTLNQGTSNAWGYSAFEGGFDPINGALVDDAIKILAYTWTSSSANQY